MVFAEETILDFSEDSLVILNDELRKLRHRTDNVKTYHIYHNQTNIGDWIEYTGEGKLIDGDVDTYVSVDTVTYNADDDPIYSDSWYMI